MQTIGVLTFLGGLLLAVAGYVKDFVNDWFGHEVEEEQISDAERYDKGDNNG